MSDGYVRWYEREWSVRRAANRITELNEAGISLRHQGNQRITMLSGEPGREGAQVELTWDQAVKAMSLTDDSGCTIQFWFRADHDLVASISMLEGGMVVTDFSLDGVSVVDRDRLFKFALGRLEKTDLLIVDLSGGSNYRAWDLLNGGNPDGAPPPMPDLVVLSDELFQKWRWSDRPNRRFGSHVALDPRDILALA